MEIELFTEMFPDICKCFKSADTKKIKKTEIIRQLFTLTEDKIATFFHLLSIGSSSKKEEVSKKCLKLFPLVYRKFVQQEREHALSSVLVQKVKKLVDPLMIKSPGQFPEWEKPLHEFEVPTKKKAKKLYAMMTFHLLSDTQVLSHTTTAADRQEKKAQSAPYDHNRLGKDTGVFLNASVTPYGSDGTFILAGAPQAKSELEHYLNELITHKVTVWISLHQKEEVATEANVFDPRVLSSLRLKDGMTIELTEEKEIAKNSQKVASNLPRIVARQLCIKKNTQKVHTIHSLHYENWQNRTPVPDSTLLEPLLEAAETLLPQKAPVIAINCHSGVGRTGSVATLLAARKAVQEAGGSVLAPSSIRINLPAILYSLQKERPGLGTEKHLIPTFQAFAAYIKKVIASVHRVFATTTISCCSSSSISSASAT